MTTSLMPLVAFLFVIAMIPVALWLMKRAGLGGAGGPQGNVLRHVAQLSLGTSQRVTVVEIAVGVERHWLVLGVTGERVTQLASYPAPDTPAAPSAPAHTAAVNQLIARWRGASGSQGSSRDA
jgi:flagellar protein FliO/FliZ